MKSFFAGKPWVRIFGLRAYRRSNIRCTRTTATSASKSRADGSRAVLVSCLDNLVKGAAGQAIQNMNVMFGWDEREGLQ